jgi:hypothetical protein
VVAGGREVVASAERRVDFIHMPVVPDADQRFFEPLADLNIGDTRLYLGLIHHDDSDPDGFPRHVELACRFVRDFGVAAVRGYGRTRRDEMGRIIDSHVAAAQQLHQVA